MDYIEFDSQKEKLLATESKIRELVGDNPEFIKSEAFNTPDKIAVLGNLFDERQLILNRLFQATEEEMCHLKRVNDYLLQLRTRLQERVDKLSNDIIADTSFDDDYNIDGHIYLPYNDESSVLKLETDSLYGSDFHLMISALDEYYFYLKKRYLWPSACSLNTLDDGVSWSNDERLTGIIICHDFYELCYNRYYSYQDIIRLNDFWAEATLVCQSITTQAGDRLTVD